jgi:hypothetical protein
MDFRSDWENANPSFRSGRVDDDGKVLKDQFTQTGHINNHFSIGPAILWSPFLLTAHVGVRTANLLGSTTSSDGFSFPYRLAMALGTVFYGFGSIWISFRLTRRHLSERWAFAGAILIWFGTALPVYMYFNPSWSHALSAFTVAAFLSFWDATRQNRSLRQWLILGLLAALMIDVYYITIVVILVPFFEFLNQLRLRSSSRSWRNVGTLLLGGTIFGLTVLIGFLPTLVAKKVIYGNYFSFGYTEKWDWTSPAAIQVAFSSDHGLFLWTPIVALSVLGLMLFARYDCAFSFYLILTFAAFLYVIGSYESWDGVSSFGNRFFVSLTPVFIIGTAAFFSRLSNFLGEQRTNSVLCIFTAIVLLWNFGLIFQWGTHMIPSRGPVSWRETVHNQIFEVPQRARREIESYLTRRSRLMDRIEQEDIQHLKFQSDHKHDSKNR